MAETAARAAAAAGVDRIVYLGGLHPAGAELSTHMRSREAVGKVFLDSPVDAVVFQAGVVIGSGSASFEMIRHLSETLPLMPAPSWVRNKIEAIAVRDVLHYLVAAASLEGPINRTFDIGCRQVLSYAGMMQEYAAEAGLPHRVVLALPVPAPKLAGLWVALTTPIPLSMSLPLVESLQHDAVSARARHRRVHPCARRRPDPVPAGRGPRPGQGTRRPGGDHVGQRRRRRRSPAQRPGLGRPRVYVDERSYSKRRGPQARLDRHRRNRRPERLVLPAAGLAACAAGWTSSPAGRGCCAAAGTRTCWPRARWWTGGGSSGSTAAGCCGCGPKCGPRAGPGSNFRWSRRGRAAATASAPSSSPRASAAACTGSRCCRSTASSFPPCRGISRPPPGIWKTSNRSLPGTPRRMLEPETSTFHLTEDPPMALSASTTFRTALTASPRFS